MRSLGLLALAFLAMLVVGRLLGRDALLVISVACNLAVLGLTVARFWKAHS